MSRYAYDRSGLLAATDGVDTCVMAALRLADSEAYRKLKLAFPDIALELERHHNEPTG